jgi:hypothetical protein
MFNNIIKKKINKIYYFSFIKLCLIIFVKIVNLDTKLDEAIFWSGEYGYIISKIYAKKNNKNTLEMKLSQSIIGKHILKIFEEYPFTKQKLFWEILSKRFAECSKGNINVFISKNNSDSIWYNVEKPSLLSNKNIKSIIIYNKINN